jgi:Capsular polysaccharide synthesis protein
MPYMISSAVDIRQMPKIVWMLWLQGWDNAPEIVRACLSTWRKLNDGWQIRALCMNDVGDVLAGDQLLSVVASKGIPPDALSDVIRIALLRKYGGVWVDSTCYCLRSLDEWLPYKISGGFFAFSKPAPDRMLSSWFLAAAENNYVIEKWYDLTVEYWLARNRRDHYYWFHYLFGIEYDTNPQFRDIWDCTPKLSANGPHFYVPYEKELQRPATFDDRELLDHPPVPLLKLTHKTANTVYSQNSVFSYLMQRATMEGSSNQFPLSRTEWVYRRLKQCAMKLRNGVRRMAHPLVKYFHSQIGPRLES